MLDDRFRRLLPGPIRFIRHHGEHVRAWLGVFLDHFFVRYTRRYFAESTKKNLVDDLQESFLEISALGAFIVTLFILFFMNLYFFSLFRLSLFLSFYTSVRDISFLYCSDLFDLNYLSRTLAFSFPVKC